MRESEIPPRRQQQVAEQQTGDQRQQDIDDAKHGNLAGGDVLLLERGQPGGPGAVFMATLPRTTAPTKDFRLNNPTGLSDAAGKDNHGR